MDAYIRQLIHLATTNDEDKGLRLIVQAYNALKAAYNNSKHEPYHSCGVDLYVQCAEVAFNIMKQSISQDCLRMYFNGVPLNNQFLCRAYLCQAQLLAPSSVEEEEKFSTAVLYLLKAVNFAKDKTRYHFLVYNASVLYYQMARPFLRPGHRHILHRSLQEIVKALDDVDDTAYEWRATLMITLVESFIDCGYLKEASAVSQAAAQLTKNRSPSKFKDVLSLQMKHNLVDFTKLAKEVGIIREYSAFFKLQKIKLMLSTNPNSDMLKELQQLVMVICGESSSAISKFSIKEGKQKCGNEDVIKPSAEERPHLLIDLARVCAEIDEVQLSYRCLAALKTLENLESSLLVEMEFVESELMVKGLGSNQESYAKFSVDVRLAAIKRMELALHNALRSTNANIVQGACTALWNLCLPLLQKNLRKHVRQPLNILAQVLEDISSLQATLRCQVHMELAKCEEAGEQIEVALKHVNKALQLDDTGIYHERLHSLLHLLQLRTQLYRTPDRPEDIATIIIQQANKTSNSGSAQMKRSLLVKAGLALAPDSFQSVLDSENKMKALSGLKGTVTSVQVLAARARQWTACISKAPGHLKRLGDENDRERFRLWVDLAKTARHQEVWDVCRVAASFCLLYDDERWMFSLKDKSFSPSVVGSKKVMVEGSISNEIQTPVTEDEKMLDNSLNDGDLLRMLAEMHFLHGEAIIHLLRCENIKLNDEAVPSHQLKETHNVSAMPTGEEAEWAVYVDWIHKLNISATKAFLRSIEIGIELKETWIVCNGAAYLWNYNNHLLNDMRFTVLVPTFEKVLSGMVEVGHSSENALLVRICDVIAKGLISPWLPAPKVSLQSNTANNPAAKEVLQKKNTPKSGAASLITGSGITMDQDALDFLKRALEVCEHGLQLSNAAVLIPTNIRHGLISTWVQVKQILQQQISPGFGVSTEKSCDQPDMTRALIMLEMLTCNGSNSLMEFIVPNLHEVCDIVERCNWDDLYLELEVWTRLSEFSRLKKDHLLVSRCTNKSLALSSSILKKKTGQNVLERHRKSAALELLCLSSCILGESLMDTSAANPSLRRQAMHSFVESAKYGKQAGSFKLVMLACRKWWNSALPFVSSVLQRETLGKPLEVLLTCILHTASQTQCNEEEGEWEDGLMVLDKAMHHMPRTKHRLILFKHRVIVKAKLGKNIQMDFAKFKGESEEYVSHMWHRVALCSRNCLEQLQAFQHSIEVLFSHNTLWQKIEYLLELATWMYCNECDIQNSILIIQWACDLLLSLKFETKVNEEITKEKFKGKKSKSSKTAPRNAAVKKNDSKASSDNFFQTKKEDSESTDSKNKEPGAQLETAGVGVKIGVNTLNKNVKIEELQSTRQLEGLIRSHVMLATICGKGTNNFTSFCELAYGFVMRLWKNALTSASNVVKQIPKQQTAGTDDGKKSSGGKRATKPIPGLSEKSKRKGSNGSFPSTTAEWAIYDPPENIKQAFVFDTSECALNKQNITCAGMSVYYLMMLSDYLCESGMNHFSLPVLSLAAVITEIILQSSSWVQLIQIKKVRVCYEVHLEVAAQHLESLIGTKFLTESEQIQCMQDLELQNILKDLAMQEEEKIQKANENFYEKDHGKGDVDNEIIQPGPITLKGKRVGGVNLGEIWTEKAKELILLGFYQPSRILLNEALTVTNHINDHVLKADIYHGLAKLAVQEGHTGQALHYLKEAQLIGGDEWFWEDNINTLIDAITLNQDPSFDDNVKINKIVKHTVDCLNILESKRPTKQSTIGYIKAILIARSCLIKLKNTSEPMSNTLEKLHQAENMLQSLGFYRQLAFIHKEHADLLLRYSQLNKRLQHSYILHALKLLEQSIASLSSICMNILLQYHEKNMCLPIRRELNDLQLHHVKVLLHAATISAEEERIEIAKEAAKGFLQKKVHLYIGQDGIKQSEDECEWNAKRYIFVHQALSTLNSLHSSLPKVNCLRAKWLYLVGKSLKILGEKCHLLEPIYEWQIPQHIIAEVKIKKSLLNDEELRNNTSKSVIDETIEKNSMLSSIVNTHLEKNADLTDDSELSYRLHSHASEILAQSVNMALQLQEIEVVRNSSIEIVECCAQCDPDLAASYLAMHQSAEASLIMKSLLLKAISEPGSSQLASLLHQESWLLKSKLTSGLHLSPLHKNIIKHLHESFMVYRRMALAENHLSLMKDLPPSFNVVILQQSLDKKKLYCAIFDKKQLSLNLIEGKSKSKEKPIPQPKPSNTSVFCINASQTCYDELMDHLEDFQQRLMSFLLQTEYQRSQLATRQKMLKNLSKDVAELITCENTKEEQAEGKKMKEEFHCILRGMENYLKPFAEHISRTIVPSLNKQANQIIQTGQPVDALPAEFLVILAGYPLMSFPFEALNSLQTPYIDSVSRDFSLQLLHQRWHVDPEYASALDEKKKTEAKLTPKGSGDGGKKTSGTPAAKIIPKNRDILPNCACCDTDKVRYIVDPHDDCYETEQYRPDEVFKQLVQHYSQSFSSRWFGYYGTDDMPSNGQWEDTIQNCSIFIFFGMERFVSQFLPSKIAALNLDENQVTILLDKSQTNKSFRHQSKVDVDKTNRLLSLEKPLETAMLLSMCGSNAVCLNQWHSTTEKNSTKLQSLLNGILEKEYTLGQAIRKITNPTLVKPQPVVEETPVTSDKEELTDGHATTKVQAESFELDGTSALIKNQLQEEQTDPMTLSLHIAQCNMVIFGLPNLVVV
ncbi:cilia- and flagella-associated protein 46-like isoform X3 [Clavelina lepadiformis]|uniref:cilia- and flagella-associated protein 46-like isoform X3 n=1 Tax=Clavelina lepadiformis TaxID=159417 RepID=UPI0040428025